MSFLFLQSSLFMAASAFFFQFFSGPGGILWNLGPHRRLSPRRHALLVWACSHSAPRAIDGFPIAPSLRHLPENLVVQNDWFSVLLIVKSAASQEVQYVLRIRQEIMLTTPDASIDGSGHLE